MNNLRFLSITVLIIYFAVLLFAVTKEKKNENVLDYFFGGRTLPYYALSITFIASWWGAGSAISTADLAYTDGISAFWYYGVPVLLSTFLMIVFSKPIRKVGYLTQGEMFKERYDDITSKILSFMILVFMIFNAASQMVGIGAFFGTYMGINYELAVIIGTGIVLIYSMFGGFRGVVLTDIIQFVLLVISAVTVFIFALNNAGGYENIVNVAMAKGKPQFADFFAGAKKYITYVITFGLAWMIQANVWQRISAARNDKDAKKMTVLSFFCYIPLYLIVVITGMAGIVLFDKMPQGGVVTSVVTDFMPPVLGALVFVGISAAIMSTMDSLINTGAMTLAMDILKNNKDENKMLTYSKYSTLFVTLVALLISLKIRSILEISWIASDLITSTVFVPLILGFIFKRGNSKGAMASMVVGFIYCTYNLLVSFSLPLPKLFESQSAGQVIFGIVISLVSYVGVSLLTKPEYEKAENFIHKSRGENVKISKNT